MNQIHFFHAFPQLEPTALELTERAFAEIHARARAAGVEFVVVLVPTQLDVEWETDAARNEAMKAGLHLGDADLAAREILAQLGPRLAAASASG